MTSFKLSSPDHQKRFALQDAPHVQSLSEKHRPGTLAEMVGQGEIVYRLESFLEAPYSCAMLFEGPTGVGKTTAAMALAAELGSVEYGGLEIIQSGMQDAEAVETVLKNLRYTPMLGSGWKVVIVEEADYQSQKASQLWLSALETLPGRSVVIFTTNSAGKFADRFLDRCERFSFKADGTFNLPDAQALADRVWNAELAGRTDSPSVADLKSIVDDKGQLSFRRVVRALEPLIASAKVVRKEETPVAVEPIVEPAAKVKKPRKPRAKKVPVSVAPEPVEPPSPGFLEPTPEPSFDPLAVYVAGEFATTQIVVFHGHVEPFTTFDTTPEPFELYTMTTDECTIIDESIPCPKCEMRIMPGESCPDCDSDTFDPTADERTLIPDAIRVVGNAITRIYENDPVASMVTKAIERLAELFERDGKLSTIDDLDTMVKFLEVPMHVYYPETPHSGFLEDDCDVILIDEDEQQTQEDKLADVFSDVAIVLNGGTIEPIVRQRETDKDVRREMYYAKKQARIERLEARAEKSRQLADAHYKASSKAIEHIPFGQPILVGHHSERRHRADIARCHRNMDKMCEESAKAKHYEQAADAASTNDAIQSNDPDAIVKLKAKIEAYERQHAIAKKANSDIRKALGTKKNQLVRGREDEVSKAIANLDTNDYTKKQMYSYAQAFPWTPHVSMEQYTREIARCEERIKSIEKAEVTPDRVYDGDGCTVTLTSENGRPQIRVVHDCKPSEDVRKKLKSNGFRWVRSEGYWQGPDGCFRREVAFKLLGENAPTVNQSYGIS